MAREPHIGAGTLPQWASLAVSLIASFPKLGKRYQGSGVPRLRRYLLRSTRYHVYYQDNTTADEVLVLTIWGAVRGTTPHFKEIAESMKKL